MGTLTVWKFDTAEGADKAEQTLFDLEARYLITIKDAATVSWAVGAKKPTTRQLTNPTRKGAMGGAFWGFLFGLIFLMPLLGAVVGVASGALAGLLADVGIDDGFIKEVRGKVRPGTSALFVLSTDAVLDKVGEAFAGQHAELIHTNLDDEQEAAIREVFSE